MSCFHCETESSQQRFPGKHQKMVCASPPRCFAKANHWSQWNVLCSDWTIVLLNISLGWFVQSAISVHAERRYY